ncbi:hypothetical protein, partial [Alistipes finegoldii]|uniref:hypothetical protein n=1 Tax=Alistipes finegoldii TaxID=214856 RepID=UPI003AB38CEE
MRTCLCFLSPGLRIRPGIANFGARKSRRRQVLCGFCTRRSVINLYVFMMKKYFAAAALLVTM